MILFAIITVLFIFIITVDLNLLFSVPSFVVNTVVIFFVIIVTVVAVDMISLPFSIEIIIITLLTYVC